MASSEPQDFEVQRILSDKVEGGQAYYLVRWKATVTSNVRPFVERYHAEIRNMFCQDGVFKIVWKDSWLPATALQHTCDELLAAYLVLKLYHMT